MLVVYCCDKRLQKAAHKHTKFVFLHALLSLHNFECLHVPTSHYILFFIGCMETLPCKRLVDVIMVDHFQRPLWWYVTYYAVVSAFYLHIIGHI